MPNGYVPGRRRPRLAVVPGSGGVMIGHRVADLPRLWLSVALLAVLIVSWPRFAASATPVLASASGPTVRLAAGAEVIDLGGQLAVLEDPDGRLTPADLAQPAAASRFRPAPAGEDLNFGYSSAAYWLRLTLVADPGAPADWLLEIAFPSLDRVELHSARGGAPLAVTGDRQPFASRAVANRNFVFPLHLTPGGEPQTVYLRVISEGSLTVPLKLWESGAFSRYSQDGYAALAIYYGMLLALMLYNLLLYLSIRDRTFLTYVFFVASMAVGQLSLNGLGNQYLWPHWPAWGNLALPVGFSATGFFGAWFTRDFLATRRMAPLLDRLILGLLGAFMVSALATIFLSYRLGAVLTSLSGLCFAATAVAAGVVSRSRGHPGARYFLLAWSLLLVGVGVMAMRNLGWLPTNWLTSYAMQIGSAVEMLLLSFALADRINTMRRERALAQEEALAAKQGMVDALRDSERKLEARVASRTRELEDAYSRLRESEVHFRAMAHHDPLTGLANRLLLTDRLDQGIERAARSGQQLAVLVLDLDGFKPINDRYGHTVGDDLLTAVSCRLRMAVRAADTVARVGGDEFVLVLDSLQTAADAARVAEKVVRAIEQPVVLDGRAVSVSVSIGIALYPQHGTTRQMLLEHADRAMYVAKRSGRNRYVSAG